MSLKTILHRLEVDAHVFAMLLYRFWSVIAGGITIILVPLCLSSIQQGYYYTFASILALQVFFELGMGQVVIQFVAHEAAHIRMNEHGEYAGDARSLSRMYSLWHFLRRWYLVAALGFLPLVSVAGWYFFGGSELPWQQWLVPWLIMVGATAYNFTLSWKIAIIEGFALVRQVYLLRLRQSMVSFVLMWAVLICGFNLWAAMVVPAVTVIYSSWWLRSPKIRTIFLQIAKKHSEGHKNEEYRVNWKTEILPFQWRIAVSWISGYFLFQLFAPAIFKYHGAVEAGRIGLGITVFTSVVTVGISWVSAKVPEIGQLLAHGKRAEASQLYKKMAKISIAFVIVISPILVLGVYMLTYVEFSLVTRLPSILALSFLAVAALGNVFISTAALFMRAHKEDPLLVSGVVSAIVTAVAVQLSVPYGSDWVVGSYAAIVWVMGVPWTIVLLRRYYRAAPT
jgi:hypothetical protein